MAARGRWFVVSHLLRVVIFAFTVSVPGVSWADEGFQSISPDDLKLTSEPLAPGAAAIILYRQTDRDDSVAGVSHQYNYYRIKVLTEQGRKYGDVRLAYFNGAEDIVHIHGRTIKPDGTIVNFDGKIFEKPLVKGQQIGLMEKVLTLPDVEVGSILEYFYTVDLKYVYNSNWLVSESLFTKHAQFSLKPFMPRYSTGKLSLRCVRHNLAPNATPTEGADHVVRMEVNNIPAFATEDHMPPPDVFKARVDFLYEGVAAGESTDDFWKRIGKASNNSLEHFIDKRGAMEKAVAEIIGPGDSPETKLRKIYARVQEIRNKSYEFRKTAQEVKRDNEKRDESVEDVWKRGYGNRPQLNWLFLALARAAGFEAYGCFVSNRSQVFFDPDLKESRRLTESVVLVKVDGKDRYFDPGAEFTPFGMLTWYETGVQGLRMDKDGGSLIKTTLPPSSESRLERKAALHLSESGDLQGKLTVTYTGLTAMYYRLSMRHADEFARKKSLEDSTKGQIPVFAEVNLTNKPDWSSSETPLIAEFDLEIPGWAARRKTDDDPRGPFCRGRKARL